jgi:hypothetical protein
MSQEILSKLVWKDPETENAGASVGNCSTIFKDCELLAIKHSKNGAKRATFMFKNKEGKTQTVAMSPRVTELYRADKITEDQILGFPVMYSDKLNSLFIGLPSSGWIEVKAIKVKDFKPSGLSLEDLIKAS